MFRKMLKLTTVLFVIIAAYVISNSPLLGDTQHWNKICRTQLDYYYSVDDQGNVTNNRLAFGCGDYGENKCVGKKVSKEIKYGTCSLRGFGYMCFERKRDETYGIVDCKWKTSSTTCIAASAYPTTGKKPFCWTRNDF